MQYADTPSLDTATLAETCGVSTRTAERWRARGKMPAALALAVALLQDGDLGVFSAAWRGWKLVRGELVSPENWCFRPGEVAAIPIVSQQLRLYQRLAAEPAQFALGLTGGGGA